MFREKIPARQLSAWMFAVIVPVGLQLLSGGSWVWVGCAGTVGVVLTWVLWRKPQEPKPEERTAVYYAKRPCAQMVESAARIWANRKKNA